MAKKKKKKRSKKGEPFSQKVFKDTLIKLEEDKKILWGHKLEAQVHGKFRTPAPLDFIVVSGNGTYFPVEVKEISSTNLSIDHFKTRQYELLQILPNAQILIAFMSPDKTKRNPDYWEEWFTIPGNKLSGIKEASVSRKKLRKEFEDNPEGDTQLVAEFKHREYIGIEENAGQTTRGNPSKGLTNIPFLTT